jgi:4-aminobutyrate transaminase
MLSVHVRTILKTMNDLTYRLPQTRTIQNLPGSKSAELNGRREASVSASIKPGLPAFIVDADGGVLVDIDGNSFIDFASGIGVTTVGASNPAVVEAVSDAVQHFTHTCFMVSPYESYVAMAEKLAKLTPGDHAKKSSLFNFGAEAVENAVKISRAYTKKRCRCGF